jgi:D-tagatose-1,6-bisphosphate aldolase subunit GatZ/KbaZ
MIEEELLAGLGEVELSRIRERLEEAMLMQPIYWQTHYQGDPERQRFARKYSPSDRSRYYWPVNRVQTSLAKLIKNLESRPPPYTLLSQYLPVQYGHIRDELIANSPRAIIMDKIASVLAEYAYACGFG